MGHVSPAVCVIDGRGLSVLLNDKYTVSLGFSNDHCHEVMSGQWTDVWTVAVRRLLQPSG